MFKRVLLVYISLFCACFFTQAQTPEIDLTQAVIIDVRTDAEWKIAHIEDVSLIPWEDIVAATDKLQLDKSKPIALFCRSGNRAGKAMALLNAAGYTQVVNIGSLEQAAERLDKPIIY
ncbi:rhodanese-like domain-containing protein [Paraglaciecola sp.]|uniref:rhodanese-like domain-containing protein n=1 Tax=Paraglaciecola sp. TaxID=1920173 RepID=UPI0030F4AF1F